MAIYDIASAIQPVNIVGNYQQGLTFGNALTEMRRKREQEVKAEEIRNGLAQFYRLGRPEQTVTDMQGPDIMAMAQQGAGMSAPMAGLGVMRDAAQYAPRSQAIGQAPLPSMSQRQIPATPDVADHQGAMNYLLRNGQIEQAGALAQLRDKMKPQSAKYYGGDGQEVLRPDGSRTLIAMTEAGPVELPYKPVSKPKYKFMDDGTVINEATMQVEGRIPVGLSPAQELQARIAFGNQNKPQAITGSDGKVYWVSPGQQLPDGVKAASAVKPEQLLPDGVANARSLYGRAVEANKMYGDTSAELLGAGKEYVPGLATSGIKIPLTDAKAFRSKEAKRLEPVQRNFIAAVLRKESGGAITEDEWSTYMPMYYPVYGDGPEEIKTKARLREAAMVQLQQASQMPAAGSAAPAPAAPGALPRKPLPAGQKPSLNDIFGGQ